MRVLHASTFDNVGGAAGAAYTLHLALRDIGLDSAMVSPIITGDDPTVHYVAEGHSPGAKARRFWGRNAARFEGLRNPLLLAFRPGGGSYSWLPDSGGCALRSMPADVINLHWVCDGMLRPESIGRLKKPVVWTLHDMWGFCGGEHYTPDETRYVEGYTRDNCPEDERRLDINRWVWRRKMEAYKNLLDLTIVTPSRWLGECAHKSVLFGDRRIEIIPYGLDQDVFYPVDRAVARRLLGLPLTKKIIAFGAQVGIENPRKGFGYLATALKGLPASLRSNLCLVVFGCSAPSTALDVGVETIFSGFLDSKPLLTLTYSAADLFAAPSLFDNLPCTVMESLACGTPVVGFSTGGIPDLVTDGVSGFLAPTKSAEGLARGISRFFSKESDPESFARSARKTVTGKFTKEIQAKAYAKLYSELEAARKVKNEGIET